MSAPESVPSMDTPSTASEPVNWSPTVAPVERSASQSTVWGSQRLVEA